MRRCKDVTNRSVSFTYKLRRHFDVSAWPAINGVLGAVFNIRMEQNVSWSFSCICFRRFSYGEKSSWQSEGISYVRSHLTKEFYWKTKVCLSENKLSKQRDFTFINPRSRWYFFVRSQIGPSFLGITWHVLLTSQISQSHLGSSWYVSATSRFGQSLLGTSWYVFSTSQIGNFHLGTRWYVIKSSQMVSLF